MKILIIRFSSIGDIVFTTPVIRCIKNQVPNAEIHYCTKAKFKSLVEENPYISKLHLLDEKQSIFQFIALLKKENFDLVIDLHSKLRSFLIKFLLFKPFRTYKKETFKKILLTQFKINLLSKDDHVVYRYLKTVEFLNVNYDHKGLDFYINHQNNIEKNSLPADFQRDYVVYVVGGSKATKKLNIEKKIELIEKISLPLILVGGKEDAIDGEEIVNKMPQKSILNLCGKYNLQQSASIIAQSKFVIGHDTGLTHIAAAYKKKIFSIWGATTPSLGFYTFETESVVLENQMLDCRPCAKNASNTCPKGHFKCMKELDFSGIKFQ